jgi:hypothetical protein
MHCLSCGAQLQHTGRIQKCEYCGGVTQLNLRTDVSALSLSERLTIKANAEKFIDDARSISALVILYLDDELTDAALNILSRGLSSFPTDAELHFLQAVALLSKDIIKKAKISDIDLAVKHLSFALKIDKNAFSAECHFVTRKLEEGYFKRNFIKPSKAFLELKYEVSSCVDDEIEIGRFRVFK